MFSTVQAHCVLVSLAFLMTPAAGLLVVLADFFADRGTWMYKEWMTIAWSSMIRHFMSYLWISDIYAYDVT